MTSSIAISSNRRKPVYDSVFLLFVGKLGILRRLGGAEMRGFPVENISYWNANSADCRLESCVAGNKALVRYRNVRT